MAHTILSTAKYLLYFTTIWLPSTVHVKEWGEASILYIFWMIENIQYSFVGRITEQNITFKTLATNKKNLEKARAVTEKCSQSRGFEVLRCESTLKSVTYLGPFSNFVFFNKQRLIFVLQIFWHFVAAVVLSVLVQVGLYFVCSQGSLNLTAGGLHHEDWPVCTIELCYFLLAEETPPHYSVKLM